MLSAVVLLHLVCLWNQRPIPRQNVRKKEEHLSTSGSN